MKIFLNKNGLGLVAIIMLAVALLSSFTALFTLPYAYYQLMNWVVVAASIMIAWNAHKIGKPCAMWVFALVAVVFNPIAPIYLNATVWQIADIIVAVLFLISFFAIKEKKS